MTTGGGLLALPAPEVLTPNDPRLVPAWLAEAYE